MTVVLLRWNVAYEAIEASPRGAAPFGSYYGLDGTDDAGATGAILRRHSRCRQGAPTTGGPKPKFALAAQVIRGV
jgi:hypothetical protein